ncbi:hypothetical protein Tco_0268121 [Tanacetum coccineum]
MDRQRTLSYGLTKGGGTDCPTLATAPLANWNTLLQDLRHSLPAIPASLTLAPNREYRALSARLRITIKSMLVRSARTRSGVHSRHLLAVRREHVRSKNDTRNLRGQLGLSSHVRVHVTIEPHEPQYLKTNVSLNDELFHRDAKEIAELNILKIRILTKRFTISRVSAEEHLVSLVESYVVVSDGEALAHFRWSSLTAKARYLSLESCSLIPTESNSLLHAHAQTTKTYYKYQDLRIKKAQELKTKTSANSNIKDPSLETKLRGRLLESFQEDVKYELVGQDTRSQDGKDDKDKQGKDLKISESKTKDHLPDAKGAYVLIFSEESHRAVDTGSGAGPSQRAYSTSTSTFSDEHISTLISLIKENSLNNNGKGIQANMAGANQHLTYNDKILVNVIDISYLRIKFSHPNGIEALITKDLMDVKLIGIGKQINGLYYFDSVEVLTVLKDDLGFDKTNNDDIPCDICQKAKQTREPFPLSEHKSTVLGELVHLDLWGPYRVISKEGHSQDLDHVNFFDEVIHEGPDTSCDNNNLSDQDQDDGSNFIHFTSPTIDHFEDELGHPQGSKGSASENEMVVTTDPNIAISEDDNLDRIFDTQNTEHVQNLYTQLLRRSERSSVFPNKYNEYVVDSKVKYGLERYVGYSNLTNENFCFVTELNKAFEQKNYWEACKDQHWIEAMNKEMDALYRNDTWDITNLPKGRKSIDCLESLKVLKSNLGKGIHIVKQPKTSLEAFVDVDWAKCLVTRKSVIGFYIKLNGSLVSWKSKKQNTLSKSFAEAKYRAMASVTSEVTWILKDSWKKNS